jgi:hypothetical protein
VTAFVEDTRKGKISPFWCLFELYPQICLGNKIRRPGLNRQSSSTKQHIRINWPAIHRAATRLPPTQMEAIPGCQGKTPAAQMHFASEPFLFSGSYSVNGETIPVQANYG